MHVLAVTADPSGINGQVFVEFYAALVVEFYAALIVIRVVAALLVRRSVARSQPIGFLLARKAFSRGSLEHRKGGEAWTK
ncbi:MAG: hypothetical protein ACRDRR_22535 [Pseudonocardiaceae bacterium]